QDEAPLGCALGLEVDALAFAGSRRPERARLREPAAGFSLDEPDREVDPLDLAPVAARALLVGSLAADRQARGTLEARRLRQTVEEARSRSGVLAAVLLGARFR